jgi:trehalose 6-phosphate synthase
MVARTTAAPHTSTSAAKSIVDRLILVSNRGPVTHQLDESGRIRRMDADGGVAVALASVARSQPVTWIAGACTFADRIVALTGKPVRIGEDSHVKLVNLPEDVYRPFYQSLCNPMLWFVQHGIAAELRAEGHDVVSAWESGYVPANRLFAEAVIEEIGENECAPVMLHDYHLYLVPRMIRDARPHAVLQQFVHIPWPRPEAWRILPDEIVRELCAGLLANDSVVFQTEDSVEAFMATCGVYLDDAEVFARRGKITYEGQTTSVWANPISVDLQDLQALARSQETQHYFESLSATRQQTIVRVDRLDPSKNVLRGLEAYELLLERRSDLLDHVRFISYLVPSRTGIPEYDDYAAAVFRKADHINSRFATADWNPVTVHYEQNRAQAFAGLRLYDVLMVNSVADGMNLVSKEGPMVNETDGVLILSRTAGSYDELNAGALSVDPLDIVATAGALEAALEMPKDERRRRSALLREAIERHQLRDWLRHQTNDLNATRHVRESAAAEISRQVL